MTNRATHPGHTGSSRIPRLVAVFALTIVTALASCSSDAAEPAPDPVDAFLERMRDEELSARALVEGTMTVGDAEFALSGNLTMSGDDSQTEIRTSVPAGDLSNERIEVDGTSFLRENGGPWFEEEARPTDDAGGDADMAAWVRSVSSVSNRGPESTGGLSLYRLVPNERSDAAALGLGDGIEARADVAFLVSRDGTLRVMEIQVDGTLAAQPLHMEMDLRFEYPDGIRVTAPDEVWTRFRSTGQRYSIGHPDGWQVFEESTSDALIPPLGSGFVSVYENHLPSELTFQEAARELLRIAERTFGGQLGDVTTISLQGVDMVLADARGRDENGAPVHIQVAIVGQGSALYELYWSSDPGNEAPDRDTFEQMVRSFRFEA